MQLPNFLLSSTGEGLAARWDAFFTGIIPVILIASKLLGWNIVEVDLNALNGQIVALISGAIVVWKSLQFIYGWARARFNKANGLGKFAR